MSWSRAAYSSSSRSSGPRRCIRWPRSKIWSARRATWRAWASSQLHRRASASTDARRMSPSPSGVASTGCSVRMASSTIPSRSAHSETVSSSKPKSSMALPSSMAPAGHRLEMIDDPLAQAPLVAAGEGVVADQLGGQAGHAEGQTPRPPECAAIANHDLEAAAAEVEGEDGAFLHEDAGPHGRVDEARLGLAVDDAGLDAGLVGQRLRQPAAVARLPEGAGGAGDDTGGPGPVGQGPEPADGGQGPAEAGPADAALPGHVVAQAEHLL